jgi:hypothetical protein
VTPGAPRVLPARAATTLLGLWRFAWSLLDGPDILDSPYVRAGFKRTTATGTIVVAIVVAAGAVAVSATSRDDRSRARRWAIERVALPAIVWLT